MFFFFADAQNIIDWCGNDESLAAFCVDEVVTSLTRLHAILLTISCRKKDGNKRQNSHIDCLALMYWYVYLLLSYSLPLSISLCSNLSTLYIIHSLNNRWVNLLIYVVAWGGLEWTTLIPLLFIFYVGTEIQVSVQRFVAGTWGSLKTDLLLIETSR